MKSYDINDILDIWEKDEKHLDDYKEKWYESWRDWRIAKMKEHWVKYDNWYKKEKNRWNNQQLT